jgi:hypothetical protein
VGTIATTTQAIPLVGQPSGPPIARDVTNGYQYALVKNTAGNYEIRRSTDSGGTWGLLGTMTRANLIEVSSIVVDRHDWLHFSYRTNESSEDRIYYRRFNVDTSSLSSELLLTGASPNGGVAGAVWQGLDLAVVRHSNGSYAIVVVVARTVGAVQYGVTAMGVSITTGGTPFVNHAIITNKRDWFTSGTAPGRSTPSVELEHNGDGFTPGSTPNVWICWGRTTLYMVRLAWQGSSIGWQGPNSHQTIVTPTPTQDYISARYDGSRYVMASINPSATTAVTIYERNRANTTTTVRVTPTHPAGVVRHAAVSYAATSGDIRVYAVGTSSTVLYYVTYGRVAGTWGAWAAVSATAVLTATGHQFAVRRGGTYGNARYDLITAHATPSPNTVLSTAQTVTSPPNTPTWDTSTQPYTNGGAADVGASLTLDWTFTHPDPTAAQASFALSRQVGVGALSYWRTSDSTWQATEQQNTSGTSALTLATAWGAGADLNHTYKVKAWDGGGLSSSYSAALVLIPSVKVNPAITAPTAAQVLTVNSVTVTWTVAEQTAYRLVLKQTSPTTGTVYDSDFVTSTATSVTVPYTLPNTTGWTVELTTKNAEGLSSTTQTRSFTVAYVTPATPTLVVTDLGTTLGVLRVAITNPTPSGGQPVLVGQDLFRRAVGATDSGTPIARGAASGAVVDDWGAAARTPYEYQAIAFGVNGTQVASAWTP